jgi:hypothetical protein
MIHYLHHMQCIKLFNVIPLSEKDTTLGAGHSVHFWFQPPDYHEVVCRNQDHCINLYVRQEIVILKVVI